MKVDAKRSEPPALGEVYGLEFYRSQLSESEQSAREYLTYLWSVFQPGSVLDVGCGRGAWLKVFAELGASRVTGYDGPWNSAGDMIDPRIQFKAIDLDRPFDSERVDLAMTLEVAEHLKPESSDAFVASLARCSDAVMFAAAFTDQGGTNHINERPHSFWGERFAALDFDVFDVFRPKFWGNEKVCFWYRQNTFMYLRRFTAVHERFTNAGFRPLVDMSFLDCVHPALFARKPFVSEPGVRELAKSLFPALRRSWAFHAGRHRGR